VPISFHEAFVASKNEERARLVRRVHMLYDLEWKNNVVALSAGDFPEVVPGRFQNEQVLEKGVATWAAGVTK
jgi:hypothetical protein